MLTLKVIIASTRPGRKGPAMASWIYDLAAAHQDLKVELVDLAEVNLPIFDEANHPIMQKYEHQHTKDWAAIVDSADAFIIVLPEYNFGFNAVIKNAIDYLHKEWQYKPVGFVSYGGVSGGTRAVQMLKQVVTALKMMPVPESVNIPAFTKFINEDGQFVAEEGLTKSAEAMIVELVKWTNAMKPLRGK
jgi:NAD(P)H-dependent FMN reductase